MTQTPSDPKGSEEVGRVCVVIEDGDYLFGVFTDEALARREFGKITGPVEFINCALFGAAASQETTK